MLGDTVQVAVVLGDNVGCCINIINILFKEWTSRHMSAGEWKYFTKTFGAFLLMDFSRQISCI